MLVDVLYKPGEVITFQKPLRNIHAKKCEFCGGSGEVIGLDGTKDECPRCEGRGYSRDATTESTNVRGPIQKIEVVWRKGEEGPTVKYFVGMWGLKCFEVFADEVIGKIENPSSMETMVFLPDGTRYYWSDWCDSYA